MLLHLHTGIRTLLVLIAVCLLVAWKPAQAQGGQGILTTLAVDWNSDATKIASVSIIRTNEENTRSFLTVYNMRTNELLYTVWSEATGFSDVKWSPDDSRLAVSRGNNLDVFAASTGELIISLGGQHQDSIRSFDWSPDGQKLITVSVLDGRVVLWSAEVYRVTNSITTGDIWAARFSPDGSRLAVGGLPGIMVFPSDLSIEGSVTRYQIVSDYVGALAWSPDGNQIAYGTQAFSPPSVPTPSSHLYVVDSFDGTVIRNITALTNSIFSIAWSPFAEVIAAYSINGQLNLWNINTQLKIESFTGQSSVTPGNIDFSPYGGRVAFGISVNYDEQLVNASLESLGISINTPDPTLERLHSIAALCDAPLTLPDTAQADQLTDFVAQVEALPAGSIPPACAADLIAVAEALQAE